VNRRRFTSLAVGAGVAGTLAVLGLEGSRAESETAVLPDRPLPVPADGLIRTAVAIGHGANVIDLCGPWEGFQDAAVARQQASSSSSQSHGPGAWSTRAAA
jgi:hypothetical protein